MEIHEHIVVVNKWCNAFFFFSFLKPRSPTLKDEEYSYHFNGWKYFQSLGNWANMASCAISSKEPYNIFNKKINTCKNLRSSSHCLTGMTLSLSSFHSFATTAATRFAETLALASSLSRVLFSSWNTLHN